MKKHEIEQSIRILVLDRLFDDKIPENVYKVTCRNVFDDSWRVNVYMKGEYTQIIPYSYLLKFSIDEGLVDSIPDIVRDIKLEEYQPERSKFIGYF